MRLVSAAKDGGNGQIIWPKDVLSVEDMPMDLTVAIEQALRICNWQENLQTDEMPPKWMWHLDWEIETWFINVKKQREAKYNSPPGSGEDTSQDWDENEYSSRFK